MRRIPVPRHDRRRTVHLRRPCGNTLLHHRRCIHGGRSDVRTRHRLISLRSRRTQSDSHRASTRSRRRCCRQRLRAPALRPHGSDLRRLNRMALPTPPPHSTAYLLTRHDATTSDDGATASPTAVPTSALYSPQLRAHTGKVVVKASPMLDAEAVAHQLHHVSDIYLIGTATECKGTCSCRGLPAFRPPTPFRLHAVTVTRGATSHITIGDDTHATAMPYVAPQTGMVIYEPYPR